MIPAIATARREPLFETLSRAVRNGAAQAWPARRTPKPIAAALAALNAAAAGSAEVIAAVRALCAESPVLLVIDEFGKSLEHLAARGDFPEAQADVFLLQELAEAGAGGRGLPLHILTLQHLSFGDYASRTTSLQSREWAKIQGRFEDITMTTHLGDAVHLIQRTLDHSGVSRSGRALIGRHAEAASEAWTAHGLDGVLAADAELFAAVYPLHPLTVAVAPLLAGQIGQHDRSLTGFIASAVPWSTTPLNEPPGQAVVDYLASAVNLVVAVVLLRFGGRSWSGPAARAGPWSARRARSTCRRTRPTMAVRDNHRDRDRRGPPDPAARGGGSGVRGGRCCSSPAETAGSPLRTARVVPVVAGLVLLRRGRGDRPAAAHRQLRGVLRLPGAAARGRRDTRPPCAAPPPPRPGPGPG